METRPIGVPCDLQPFEQVAGADHRLHPVLELGDDQRVQLLHQLDPAAGLAEPAFDQLPAMAAEVPTSSTLVRPAVNSWP